MRALALVSIGCAAALGAACGHNNAASSPNVAAPAATVATPKELSPAASIVARIDASLRAAWAEKNVVPARRADDATFVRRAYVDIVGTIPSPEAAQAFIASDAPDKRKKLVDTLLASPEYGEHWMNYWDDVLMGRQVKGPVVDRLAFRYWLRARFEANAPWDRIVRDLVAPTGQNSLGGARVRLPQAIAQMATDVPLGGEVPRKGEEDAADLDSINGAVNWPLRFEQSPQDLAGTASRVFLGVQIQCAQCHDHKTEKWKQEDFQRFAAAFLRARVEPLDGKGKGVIRRIELVDIPRMPPRLAKKPELAAIARAKPTALDGTDLDKGEGTRKALAAWMTAKDNPWFAKAFVNRMWGHFLGRGFYDPVDDLRAASGPALPALLDEIAADFAAHDFDVAYLIRTIAATEAYQLAAAADAKPDPENALWARFHLVPLGPEELLNALLRATDLETAAQRAGVQNMEALRLQLVRQYAFLFETDEADDVPDYSGTVTQALSLLNGALVGHGARSVPGSALDRVLATPGDDGAKIDALSLRVLSRKPTAEERARYVKYVQNARSSPAPPAPSVRRGAGQGPLGRLGNRGNATTDPRRAAYEDLMWAMLNSSEFVFNH